MGDFWSKKVIKRRPRPKILPECPERCPTEWELFKQMEKVKRAKLIENFDDKFVEI